ncbi:MAG: carbohydrate ABC transporter permease [Spirochaetia bacterium]|jgi:multiple sugar transport system permease protein/raffinose/stachyose/melibiose transport system permease protein
MSASPARRGAAHGALVVLAFMSLVPFLFMLLTSFKSNEQFYHSYYAFALPPQWGNYVDAWAQIGGYFFNSITVTLVSVAISLLFASIAAYAFARYRFPGSGALYAGVLLVLLIPGTLTLIPAFVILRDLGLIGTHRALYAVYIADSEVLGIIILKTFFGSVPEELMEAAALDGAGELQTIRHIVTPLARPALLTVAIMTTLSCWNDYLWPLIVLPDTRKWTISLGLVAFRDRYAGMSAWGPLFAGFVIASIPLFILFFAFMRQFVSGLTSGAVKA